MHRAAKATQAEGDAMAHAEKDQGEARNHANRWVRHGCVPEGGRKLGTDTCAVENVYQTNGAEKRGPPTVA